MREVRTVTGPVSEGGVTRDSLLTPDDVAEVLRVKRSTALDWMRRGVVPARKIGRYWFASRAQVEQAPSRAVRARPLPVTRWRSIGSVSGFRRECCG